MGFSKAINHFNPVNFRLFSPIEQTASQTLVGRTVGRVKRYLQGIFIGSALSFPIYHMTMSYHFRHIQPEDRIAAFQDEQKGLVYKIIQMSGDPYDLSIIKKRLDTPNSFYNGIVELDELISSRLSSHFNISKKYVPTICTIVPIAGSIFSSLSGVLIYGVVQGGLFKKIPQFVLRKISPNYEKCLDSNRAKYFRIFSMVSISNILPSAVDYSKKPTTQEFSNTGSKDLFPLSQIQGRIFVLVNATMKESRFGLAGSIGTVMASCGILVYLNLRDFTGKSKSVSV